MIIIFPNSILSYKFGTTLKRRFLLISFSNLVNPKGRGGGGYYIQEDTQIPFGEKYWLYMFLCGILTQVRRLRVILFIFVI